ncbi:MAG: hypothetical protein IK008_03060 [Bacteroidales bacterium]|nr:hypothetical protein [Bacteroidales bacterium]
MKKLGILLMAAAGLFMVGAFNASAQPQQNPDPCSEYTRYYQDYLAAKNNKDAFTSWRVAYSICPKNFKQNIYIHGAKMMKSALDRNIAAKNFELAHAQYDSLLTLLDERLQYYPQAKKNGVVYDTKREILTNKGFYVIQYISDLNNNDQKFFYESLKPIMDELGDETAPKILRNVFSSAVALYRDNQLGAEDIISLYDTVSGHMENYVCKDEAEEEDKAKQKGEVESIFASSNVASCDNLITIFGPRYEADPENLSLVSNIVNMMQKTEGCASTDLYYKAVNSMHKMKPSHSSAYALYKLNAARGNVADAAASLQQAIDAEESGEDLDAQYNYEMAAFCYKNGMRGKAYDAARRAIDLDKGYAGKAYLIMGNLWASAPCGDTVGKWARYWVATDYYQKARNVDASLASDASAKIANASRYYPAASDAFMYDLTKGQSYTVSCGGMSATTTVRVQ